MEHVELMPHQKEALQFLDNGKILYGGVGAGKSITALAYYLNKESPKNVYVITTARKRDTLEWLGDAAKFGIGTTHDSSVAGLLTIDSWNNIDRYTDVRDSFFIFDEQRLVGHGAWVKSFLKIVRGGNRWILLTATPGDSWLDYAPIFIANGWYKNITDFKRQHIIYAPYVRYPKIIRCVGEERLERLRSNILIEMQYRSHTNRIMNYMDVGYDKDMLLSLQKNRWHPYEERPLKDISELWRLMRAVVNTHPSRIETVDMLTRMHPRLIVYYNFDYELAMLRQLDNTYEWNGHKHDPLPTSERWVYLVQYTAGSEGWNCTSTDAMCLYSMTYSYKAFRQSFGRIDRLDTPYTDLYYYILRSDSFVDKMIQRAMTEKRDFNERIALKELVSHDTFGT